MQVSVKRACVQMLGEPGSPSKLVAQPEPKAKVQQWLQHPHSQEQRGGARAEHAEASQRDSAAAVIALADMGTAAIDGLAASGFLAAHTLQAGNNQNTDPLHVHGSVATNAHVRSAQLDTVQMPQNDVEQQLAVLKPLPARLTSEALQKRRDQISSVLHQRKCAPSALPESSTACKENAGAAGDAATGQVAYTQPLEGTRTGQVPKHAGSMRQNALAVRTLTAKMPELPRQAVKQVRHCVHAATNPCRLVVGRLAHHAGHC